MYVVDRKLRSNSNSCLVNRNFEIWATLYKYGINFAQQWYCTRVDVHNTTSFQLLFREGLFCFCKLNPIHFQYPYFYAHLCLLDLKPPFRAFFPPPKTGWLMWNELQIFHRKQNSLYVYCKRYVETSKNYIHSPPPRKWTVHWQTTLKLICHLELCSV